MVPIPVIDLFAGPGGLGEGFSALGRPDAMPSFQIRLSIEKDPIAHQTLELRAFFRQFPHGRAPEAYYHHLRGEEGMTRDALFAGYPMQAAAAREEAWLCELSHDTAPTVSHRIAHAVPRRPPRHGTPGQNRPPHPRTLPQARRAVPEQVPGVHGEHQAAPERYPIGYKRGVKSEQGGQRL